MYVDAEAHKICVWGFNYFKMLQITYSIVLHIQINQYLGHYKKVKTLSELYILTLRKSRNCTYFHPWFRWEIIVFPAKQCHYSEFEIGGNSNGQTLVLI